jgi:hypothetical protein
LKLLDLPLGERASSAREFKEMFGDPQNWPAPPVLP